jgi:hypothetical protein
MRGPGLDNGRLTDALGADVQSKQQPDYARAISHCQETAGSLSHGKMTAMPRKNPHAVALGRKGGLKGGKARWEGVTAEQRREIARRAARARWKKDKKKT